MILWEMATEFFSLSFMISLVAVLSLTGKLVLGPCSALHDGKSAPFSMMVTCCCRGW